MTDLIYLTDSYKKEYKTRITSVERRGATWHITLQGTIFYPEGGGQPSDKGTITGPNGKAMVKHVRLVQDTVIHECSLKGTLAPGDEVETAVDWPLRYYHMRVHSAGHVVHEAVRLTASNLVPLKGEHGRSPFIEYIGSLTIDKKYAIEEEANAMVEKGVVLKTEFVSLEELMKRSVWVPAHLPTNKPLRILIVGEYDPIPDGGTQVKNTSEIGPITITAIKNADDHVRVFYEIEHEQSKKPEGETTNSKLSENISTPEITHMLLETEASAKNTIAASESPTDLLRLEVLGAKSPFAQVAKQIKRVPPEYRQEIGTAINYVKANIERALHERPALSAETKKEANDFFDVTMPGVRPPEGHLHIVTQAIMEISRIFERIGFSHVRHPEVDWDYYAFESLNMPKNHPARDEWETFFIQGTGEREPISRSTPGVEARRGKIVLTPHTSNGQVREMEKGKLPIRMINIAKCYRRQIDVSHTPMHHQFEGLLVDKNVSIGHLKGVFDYFVKSFFGPDRKTRLRPFHFQFTEPSFEVDINCGICLGTGKLPDGSKCKLCKAGWLELGGAGMVHPNVLKAGGIDPEVYSGFAFGWGIERTYMMKSGTNLDDIRMLYSNDVRFLQQF